MKKKMCMLEDNKTCDNCCECDVCDLDPCKVCDNCAKCIDSDKGFRTVTMNDLIEAEEMRKRIRLKSAKIVRNVSK